MKKVISLAVLVLACTLYSCSGDSNGTPQAGGTVAEDIGGQQGQLPVPTPPPPTRP